MKIIIGNYSNIEDGRNLILNDTVTIDGHTQLLTLISNVEGLETAPYRNGTGDWSGADGGYISSQLFSARTITISGAYIDKEARCDYTSNLGDPFDRLARLHIRSRLPIRTKQYIRIFLDSGLTFITEGYCIDIKMDYNYVGYGEYQIVMYCPDPALYSCASDGALGSEWAVTTVRKENKTGYISSEQTSDGTKYASMTNDDGENHGIVWRQGGRSTPIMYDADYPYSPQFIIEPGDGEHITNPRFYSLTEDKFFGLGYPSADVAKFTVTMVDINGGILGLSETTGGQYENNMSTNGVLCKAYSYVNDGTRTEFGTGAILSLNMSADSNEMWSVASFAIKDGGQNYQVGDVITPQLDGATILQLAHGDKVVIDMAEHTALLNGKSISYYITPGSEWLQLQPYVANNFLFESADEADADYAQVRWRRGYLGI